MSSSTKDTLCLDETRAIVRATESVICTAVIELEKLTGVRVTGFTIERVHAFGGDLLQTLRLNTELPSGE